MMEMMIVKMFVNTMTITTIHSFIFAGAYGESHLFGQAFGQKFATLFDHAFPQPLWSSSGNTWGRQRLRRQRKKEEEEEDNEEETSAELLGSFLGHSWGLLGASLGPPGGLLGDSLGLLVALGGF